MSAANDALAQEDPKSHDIEELSDPEGAHIEMVRPPFLSMPSLSTLPIPPCTAQNLACGVLEGKPVAQPEEPIDTADLVNKLADASTEEPIDELQMPARQTPAVARAAQAGRILVSEVAPPHAARVSASSDEEQAEEPGSCADPPKTRKRRSS